MKNSKSISRDELLSLDKISSYILNQYNLKISNIIMVKFKDTDKQRAVYKVECGNKSYCLKKVYFDEANLLYVYSALEWLHKNNLNVPRLTPTANNHRYITYKDMLFILTPWLDGEKCDFDNLDHLKLSARALGQLHKVSRNFTPIQGSALREGLSDYNNSVSKHFNQLLVSTNSAHKYRDDFSNIFLDNLDEHLELAKLSMEISSSINTNELSKSLCHGDYVNKNIIISGDDVCIIDFDKCKYDYSAHDLSYLLRRLLKRENTNWDALITTTIIDNYLISTPLTSSDLKYILSYISFPQKYWKLSRDYYKNISKCNKASFATLLQKNIERSSSQLEFIYEMIRIFESKYKVTF